MARRTRTTTWRIKLLLLLCVFALMPVGAVTLWMLDAQEDVSRKSTLEAMEPLVEAKAEAIDQFTSYRKSDVERMANLIAPSLMDLRRAQRQRGAQTSPPAEALPDLKDAEQLPPGGEARPSQADPPAEPASARENGAGSADDPVSAATAVLRRRLGLLSWDQEEFEELIIMDETGRVIVSTFEDHEGHTADALEYFRTGRKMTFLQPVFMSPITNQLTMVIATPIRSQERELLGVLAARLNLKRFYRLINDKNGLGRTGETIVAKKLGDEAVFMAPTRHDAEAALERRFKVESGASNTLSEAVLGRRGSGEIIDYRGVPVFAAWQHIPALEWGIAVKIDVDEALSAATATRQAALGVSAVVVGLAIVAAFALSKTFVAPLRELQQATERISRGDFDVAINVRSRDEIGELADSFERMIAAIKFFRERSRPEDEDIDGDLDSDVR